MKYLFTPPSLDDFIRLLRAWRFWMLCAFLGAILGAIVYYIIPPPFRARATVNVDFNLEQAWPQDTDRQQFNYLEREARKLEELAWSDDVMGQLSSQFALTVADLRGSSLQLGQPAEAGWHFYADDSDPQIAALLASSWAQAFVDVVQDQVDSGTVNEYVRLEVTQSQDLPTDRSIPLSGYLLAGSLGFLTAAVFVTLLIKPRAESVIS